MATVITAIIGHRGAGKTEFLRRATQELTRLGRQATFVDIDREIEKRTGRPITELFAEIGEEEFRRLERSAAGEWFDRLRAGPEPGYVSLGAGFDGQAPADVHVLWIRRPTDESGRIFLDRPALEPGLGPLEEYRRRHAGRDSRFRELADETLIVGEGRLDVTDADRLVLGLDAGEVGGCLTLLPENLRDRSWKSFLEKRLRWGIDMFEIRDDILDETMCSKAEAIPPEKRLVSYRTGGRLDPLTGPGVHTDWALELSSTPRRETSITSVHALRAGETVLDAARRLEDARIEDSHLKLAVPVAGFDELWQGHQWWLQDVATRSFLPCSDDGRWAWYRRLRRGQMLVNFLREGDGTSPDQPTLLDWVTTPLGSSSFAAILGDPVQHSRTPSEHGGFFGERHMPVMSIRMTSEECTTENLEILARLGLTHAAVTSPLKEAMYSRCEEVVGAAKDLRSVNAVMRVGDSWIGTNTDGAGLEALVSQVGNGAHVAIWGGGGTRAALRQALPEAVPFSARTGLPLEGQMPEHGPEILVWAVGRNRQAACRWPPPDWRPTAVLDLNYSEDSPGLEYAWRLGVTYTSGLEMFRAQATAQREFWNAGQ